MSIFHEQFSQHIMFAERAFDGNQRVAEVLTNVICSDFSVDLALPNNYKHISLEADELGLWIDPIDSTLEYITGEYNEMGGERISRSGLHNVTVLIGAFSWSDGLPFLGVVNQPFFERASVAHPWRGQIIWGVTPPSVKAVHSVKERASDRVIVTSSSDAKNLERCFANTGVEVTKAPGAGYKQLCVIDGRALAYVLFNSNTYRWDSCAPHGVLRAMGGGILRLKDAMERVDEILNSEGQTQANLLRELQVTYTDDVLLQPLMKEHTDRFINSQGLLVYPDEHTLMDMLKTLRKDGAKF